MKNLLAILALITASAIYGFGQNTTGKTVLCTNETVEKISSRGIKIGADINDVLNLFASTDEEKQRIRNSASGEKRRNIGYDFFGASPKENDDRFAGISSYTFEFLDGKAVGFSIAYLKPKWIDVNQFAGKLSEFFDLPKVENWNQPSSGTAGVQCGDYYISAQADYSYGLTNSFFAVRDTRIGKLLENRKENLEKQQREKDIKTFKP